MKQYYVKQIPSMSYEVLQRCGHAEFFIQEHGDSVKGHSKGSKEGFEERTSRKPVTPPFRLNKIQEGR